MSQWLGLSQGELWRVKPNEFEYPGMDFVNLFTPEQISEMSWVIMPHLVPMCLLPTTSNPDSSPAHEMPSSDSAETQVFNANDTSSPNNIASSAGNTTRNTTLVDFTESRGLTSSPGHIPSSASNTSSVDFTAFPGLEDDHDHTIQSSMHVEGVVAGPHSRPDYCTQSKNPGHGSTPFAAHDTWGTPSRKRKRSTAESPQARDQVVHKRGFASSSPSVDPISSSYSPYTDVTDAQHTMLDL
ncbi:hypothetical protein AC578_4222 [Pseudocercospora eumusae]|uniref:Uncharacterized protein n=1 Tax=Pseudocercospora eumusae TaxID=321146 RepID=A0A139H379_9PEZI|nr:hypothetical protein AC578_4222 [Pseudocercospora eumusae]